MLSILYKNFTDEILIFLNTIMENRTLPPDLQLYPISRINFFRILWALSNSIILLIITDDEFDDFDQIRNEENCN